MDLANLGLGGPNLDPFQGNDTMTATVMPVFKEKIHIRFTPGKRAVTLIEGLDDDLDQVRIARAMKREFKCAVSVHKDKAEREVIKLQGDQCMNVKDWLLAQEILTKKEAGERIVIHRL
jgi:translation initiation factor SUI1